MQPFAMFGKVVAKVGRRDALVDLLLEASRLLAPLAGCQLYIVNIVPAEPETVWVTELWRSQEDHDASLKMDSVKALIARAVPLMAAGSSESIRLVPVGGKGMPAA